MMKSNRLDKKSVFDTPAPLLSKNEAGKIALKQFGIAGTVESLVSDRDQNFKILGEDQSYILKISNTAEEYDVLDMQNKAMEHMAKTDTSMELPLAIPSINGDDIIEIESNGESNWARLLHYIDGQFLTDINQSIDMLFELGKFLGNLDFSLKDFSHSASKRYFPWDVRCVDFLKTHHFKKTQDKILVNWFLNQYESCVLPMEDQLRKMVIHNDGNDHNVLVNRDGSTTGIIDFGDMIYSYIALEPAVCMAYVALEKDDPLGAIAQVLKGFHYTFPLNKSELKSVIYLMCLRLCISITMASYRQPLFPENPYLSISVNPAKEFLNKMKNKNLADWSDKLIAIVNAG
ncbi:MAG: phosphotransferase [Candidatus Marinimicrobia bacterium]|nr:phosphotransferase [Candidatus Neomarinimicrobiota bacterium]